jgi:hypothetical protein
MKKTTKLISTLTVLTLLSCTAVFAQQTKKSQNPVRSGVEVPAEEHIKMQDMMKCGMGRGHGPHGFADENDSVIIGTVKTLNVKANTLTVVNADGKDETVSVTPFTRIHAMPDTPPAFGKNGNTSDNKPVMPEMLDLAKLSKGDWVRISTAKTETKVPVASKIIVKQVKPAPIDNSNSK